MNRTIYTNDITSYDREETKQIVAENREISLDEVTDEMIDQEIYDDMEFSFDAECCNLNQFLDNNIVAIANLGLWYGNRPGYKVITSKNLKEILYIGNQDINTIYYDGYNVRKKAIHHDGTNHILFREFKPNVNQDKFCEMVYNGEITPKLINQYTRSLRRHVKKVYGF